MKGIWSKIDTLSWYCNYHAKVQTLKSQNESIIAHNSSIFINGVSTLKKGLFGKEKIHCGLYKLTKNDSWQWSTYVLACKCTMGFMSFIPLIDEYKYTSKGWPFVCCMNFLFAYKLIWHEYLGLSSLLLCIFCCKQCRLASV